MKPGAWQDAKDIVVTRTASRVLAVSIWLESVGLQRLADVAERWAKALLVAGLSDDMRKMLVTKVRWRQYKEGRAE